MSVTVKTSEHLKTDRSDEGFMKEGVEVIYISSILRHGETKQREIYTTPHHIT